MAKKKATKRGGKSSSSETTEERGLAPVAGEVELVSDVSAHVQIDKDDVIALGINQAEEFMQEQLEHCQEEQRKQQKLVTEHSERFTKILIAAAEEYVADMKAALREALKVCAVKKVGFAVRPSGPQKQQGKKGLFYSIQLIADENNGHNRHSSSFTFSQKFVVPLPKEAKEAHDEMGKCQAEYDQLAKEALEWKRRMARVPQLERSLKADLAKTRLSKSEEGQRLLDSMISDVKDRVLRLPGK